MRTVTDTDSKSVVICTFYPEKAVEEYESLSVTNLWNAIDNLRKVILELKPRVS